MVDFVGFLYRKNVLSHVSFIALHVENGGNFVTKMQINIPGCCDCVVGGGTNGGGGLLYETTTPLGGIPMFRDTGCCTEA